VKKILAQSRLKIRTRTK